MKERPILFSAPMVRAILDGSKTQTRRALRIQPLDVLLMKEDKAGVEWVGLMQREPEPKGTVFRCKFGKPGDRLWVRETWQGPLLGTAGDYKAFNAGGQKAIQKPECCVYRATDTLNAVDDDGRELGWRPSIHMPRWASRILLEITGVRVERLQDISEEDAAAEGIHYDRTIPFNGPWFIEPSDPQGYLLASSCYQALWEQINGPGSWNANPWVWVVEFKRVQP